MDRPGYDPDHRSRYLLGGQDLHYAHDFKQVELSRKEQQQLNSKLKLLGYKPAPAAPSADKPETDSEWLRPERYDDTKGKRELFFTERELNGLLANNRDLAKKLAVDLSDDMVSARLLVHVDPDFPILGVRPCAYLPVSKQLSMTSVL